MDMNQGGGISPQQIIKNSKQLTCENCGGIFFKQSLVLRKVSKVLTGTPQDQIIPFPLFRCDDCGQPISETMVDVEDNNESLEPKSEGESKLKLIT